MKILKRSTCYSIDNRNLGGVFVSECDNRFFVVVYSETGKVFFIRKCETCLEAGLIFREILDYCVKFYEKKEDRTFWREGTEDFYAFKKYFEEAISKMGTEEFTKTDDAGKGVNPRIIEIMTQ